MAVAFDAFSNVAAGTGDLSWTHTPVGTPRGVKVDIVENGGTNGVTGVTYGGVAMELVAANTKTSGEAGTVITYFLGKSIPTGAQTISVTVSDAVSKLAGATTVTASTDTCWISTDVSIGSDSIVNPSSTLNLLGKTCFVSLAGHSGQGAVTGTTPTTGWTSRLEHDFGAQVATWYTYNTISTADVACGWTQTADDAVMVALAITEAPLCSDSLTTGLTESSSVAVIFDSRALPIIITESAAISIVQSVSDACQVQIGAYAILQQQSIAISEALQVQQADSSSVSFSDTLSLLVSDSLSVAGNSEGVAISTIPVTASDQASLALSEVRQVVNTQTGAIVFNTADSCSVAATDIINDVLVFVPGSVQNFVVSDSVKVQLNGSGVTPTEKSATDSLAVIISEPSDQEGLFSVVDGVAAQVSDASSVNTGSAVAFFSVTDISSVVASDSATVFANTVLAVSDSCRTQSIEDIPDVATVIRASDSLRVVASEPSDQFSQFGVIDSLAFTVVNESGVISGMLPFFASDSFPTGFTEVTSFGSIAANAVDSLRIQVVEALSNSASVNASDNLSIRATETISLTKSISVLDGVTVQIAESAAPIFSEFIQLSATDSCAVSISESVTELINFLTQISVSDSLEIHTGDTATDQSVTLSAVDISAAQCDEAISILNTQSSTDSLNVVLSDVGLAIPLVTVNVTTFANDIFPGFNDTISGVTAQQPSAEDVAFALLEELRLDLSGALTESSACRLTESAHITVTAVSDDSQSIGLSDTGGTTAAYLVADTCNILNDEATDGYVAVANETPETWNGEIPCEHGRQKPKPWNFIIKDRYNW